MNVYFWQVDSSNIDQCFNNSENCKHNERNFSIFTDLEDYKLNNHEINLNSLLGPKILSYEKPFELSSIEGLSSECERDYKIFLDSLEKLEF